MYMYMYMYCALHVQLYQPFGCQTHPEIRRLLSIFFRIHMLDANVAVLGGYMLLTTAAALLFSQRQRSRADAAGRSGEAYFLGGRSMGGWALGCSLVATQMSSVTFLAYPATSFATNWLLLNACFGLPLVSIFTATWVVPFFRRAVSLSAYELLEARFNLTCRLYVALCYCLLQLARTCTILFLVSFPLAALLGASQALVIVASGARILTEAAAQ